MFYSEHCQLSISHFFQPTSSALENNSEKGQAAESASKWYIYKYIYIYIMLLCYIYIC